MVSNDIDRRPGAIKIMAPNAERLKDGEELLVMDIIIELCRVKRTRVESDGMNFTVLQLNGENSRKGIIRSVSLNNDRAVGYPMSKNRSRGESGFKRFKSGAFLVPK